MSWWDGLLQILTLRCEAASELASRALDESLPYLDRAALSCHLLACKSCRRFCKQIRVIRTAIRRRERFLLESDADECLLSSDARDRIAENSEGSTRKKMKRTASSREPVAASRKTDLEPGIRDMGSGIPD
jgi:predicted anti-sigma-YlaC factor YlaD